MVLKGVSVFLTHLNLFANLSIIIAITFFYQVTQQISRLCVLKFTENTRNLQSSRVLYVDFFQYWREFRIKILYNIYYFCCMCVRMCMCVLYVYVSVHLYRF